MVGEFLDYLRFEKNRSELTVSSYAEDLKAFEAYFKNLDMLLSWETVDADVIRGWMESMMDKGNRATSVNRRLSALRSFYRYALAHQKVARDPSRMIKGPKKAKPLPQFLKEEEMNRLLDVVEWGDDFESVRARTMLMAFYETGIRLSELTGLDDTAIDWANHAVKVLGKRNKQRIIPLGEELEHTLLIYISGRVSSVGRSINTMVRRSSMLGGRGCVMGRRINIMLGRNSMKGGTGSTVVGRVDSAVGSIRTKAIKKGSTEALPLNVLLI